MTAQEIYNLVRYHPYFKKRTQQELLVIFENAYQSLIAFRNEEVDLTTIRPKKLYPIEKPDEKFGIQAIDSKIALAFPSLTQESRLLLYRIAQNKIRLYNPEDYTFDTIRGTQFRRFDFISSLDLLATVITPVKKEKLFISDLVLKLQLAIKQSLEFVSSLGLTLGIDPKKLFVYESTIRPVLTIYAKRTSNYVYSQGLGLALKLQSHYPKIYTQDLGLRLRTFNETDYQEELIYTTDLQLTLTIE